MRQGDFYTYSDGVYICTLCGANVRTVSGRRGHLLGPHAKEFGISEEPRFNPIRSQNRTKRMNAQKVLAQWYSSQDWSRVKLTENRDKGEE